MLELKNIRWRLPEGEEILKGVNMKIPDGKLTVVTGPNGGGKTSIAKMIAGLYSPTEGEIFLDGTDITEYNITERARQGIAYAFQQPVRFKGLTVRDLIETSAERKLDNEFICGILGDVGLCAREYMNREADASLSGGESKRIEIATVLARKNASMLVFDEPEAGIDLWSFGSLINAFERLKNEGGRSLLIISHQERIMEIADYIIVISGGKVSAEGSREEILPGLLKENSSGEKCPLGRTVPEKEDF
ncbi:MAG: ATP-binding cassette domain-containing protein [Oscillospiraceae bacterium]|jgi:Fe-S cluster assembly ATP-binding protein|nr:ATP-binding cassette domain-containing protein [Oscillospiraceae bacterium]